MSARPQQSLADPDHTSRQRVEPQLRDLMSLYRPASLLPSWARSIRANQSGATLSAMKGRGMEYDESRPYQAGDDIRTLDWRVTARTGKPHTKVFREERERPVYICCDFSPSMFFATQGVFKSVVAARAAALIAWKAQQSGDRVGGLVFSAATHTELPPERGKPGVIRLLKSLVESGRLQETLNPPESLGVLGKAISRLTRVAKPGSLIFLLSDFREFDNTNGSDLANLARHNDITCFFVNDPFEAAIPSASAKGRVTNGRSDIEIAFSDRSSNKSYAENFDARYEQVEKLARENRIHFGRLATNEESLPVLQRVLGLY